MLVCVCVCVCVCLCVRAVDSVLGGAGALRVCVTCLKDRYNFLCKLLSYFVTPSVSETGDERLLMGKCNSISMCPL